MTYLTDGEVMLEVVSDREVENHGMLGGTCHVLLVREPVEHPGWRVPPTCSCSRCDREPEPGDGRRMGDIERSRFQEIAGA